MPQNAEIAPETADDRRETRSRRPSIFDDFPGVRVLNRRFEKARESDLNLLFFMPHESVNGATVVLDGRECVNFSGYNYVGLCGHPEVSKAARDAIDRYGTSVSASRIVSGQIPLHDELERALADFLGTEDAIVMVSGYGTNVTTIGHLFGRNDLVAFDSASHNSLINGCKLSDAERLSFPHNDPKALGSILADKRGNFDNVLIAIESLYSMDGDIAPLPEFVDLRNRMDAILMVDEAHSLGTIGATGRGVAEHFGIERDDADIWMGTLSKTLAGCGGYIAGDHSLIEYLRYSAPGFIFSVGLSPPDTAAALAALRILEREPWRCEKLQARAAFFRETARQEGIEVPDGVGPIVPVIIGDSYECMQLSERLYDAGIHVQAIVYPAVGITGARLRFFVTVDHTEEQIRSSIAILGRELRALESKTRLAL